ncbi:nitric-oxide reductase large subunit [candidate division GN15 bacterium]|nr:nitric-oxide reductase large subunit [candidate division GN15 bacterium]
MRRLWIAFILVVALSFAVLGWAGIRIYQEKPPIPTQVVTTEGEVVVTEGQVNEGQAVWRAMGGMELGSVWGHGSYVAPDWTADWLHRECVFILDQWAQQDFGTPYDDLHGERQAALRERLTQLMRTNTYDEASGTITISPVRARAYEANQEYYHGIFTEGHVEYAIPESTLTDPARIADLGAFFFWSAWAASTNRIDDDVTYTGNWPHEPLIKNKPTSDAIIWTGFSIIMLLGGIGLLVWYHASRKEEQLAEQLPAEDPLIKFRPTPSQLAIVKYFWTVAGLFLLQMTLGVITAHYGVEGDGFYGIPIDQWLPYTVARTWHTQLGIFWIATAWLAAGLFIGPAVSGREMPHQRLGVNVLYGALVTVVLGSMTGEWLSVKGYMTGDSWFWFGHQGYEYVDLGRFWQIALLIGLGLWLWLVGRNIVPGIRQGGDQKPIMTMFLISSIAIGGFYMAGLMWGKHTHLSIAEYWRWWVVHLWVEGFFEVFATAVIAFLFARLGLVRLKTANAAVLFSTTIFLTGGIVGTLHHLYFSGTPTSVMALGAVFSALEVVPLTIIGFEAWENIRLTKSTPWMQKYRWPIFFFVAVAFWNMVGAGLFGFMINPPIALYYMQGLNTTPVHAHTALFGVYGMLGLGLMLFCLRVLYVRKDWKDRIIKTAFWTINVGLGLMVGISLLPIGFLQTWASVEHGYWFARSAEFLYSPTVTVFKWLRAPGDIIFALGITILVLFVFGLATGHSLKKDAPLEPAPEDRVKEPVG